MTKTIEISLTDIEAFALMVACETLMDNDALPESLREELWEVHFQVECARGACKYEEADEAERNAEPLDA
jgi:hypothetical protein